MSLLTSRGYSKVYQVTCRRVGRQIKCRCGVGCGSDTEGLFDEVVAEVVTVPKIT